MAVLNTAKVIRGVRQRLKLSQEGLSRLVNATKGAVQHWERGRNNPDLARLLALRRLCPPGEERRELDTLIRQAQAQVTPLSVGRLGRTAAASGARPGGAHLRPSYSGGSLALLRRENIRLDRQVAKLQATLQRRNEQLRILEDLAMDLHRQIAQLRAGQSGKTNPSSQSAT